MRTIAAAVSIPLLLVAGVASADSAVVAAAVEELPEGKSPLKLTAIYETAVGTGTFVSDRFSDNPYVVQGLSLRPAYVFEAAHGKPKLTLRQDLTYELTEPDLANGRRFDPMDTLLQLSSAELWKEPASGIKVTALLGATLPVSYTSRIQKKYTALSAGTGLTRSLYGFDLAASVTGAKHLFRYTTMTLAPEEATASDGLPLNLCDDAALACNGGTYLFSWTATATGSVGYSVTDELSATLELRYLAYWNYPSPEDELTSAARTVDGDRVVDPADGRDADRWNATLDVSYTFTENFSVSTGVTTLQPLLTADNRSNRNLLFDDRSPTNNFTSLYLDLVATF